MFQDLFQQIFSPDFGQEDVVAAVARLAVEGHDVLVRLRVAQVVRLGFQLGRRPAGLLPKVHNLGGSSVSLRRPCRED